MPYPSAVDVPHPLVPQKGQSRAFDTAGKSAERTTSQPITSAPTPNGPAVSPESAGSTPWDARLIAISRLLNTLPAVSKVRQTPDQNIEHSEANGKNVEVRGGGVGN